MTNKIDPSDEREGGEIIKDAACCEDGCCSWHDNSTAQSGKVKTGDIGEKST